MNISSDYRPPLKFAAVLQAIILPFSLLADLLDFFKLCLIAALAFWGAAAFILFRRPRNPTKADLTFLKYGYLIIFAFGSPLVAYLWSFKIR